MEIFTTQHPRGPEFIVDCVLQMCLVVGLAGLTVLIWPDGMLRTPISTIPLGDWVWAFISALVGGLAALFARHLVIETVVVLYKALRPGNGRQEKSPDSGTAPNLFEMQYESERDQA